VLFRPAQNFHFAQYYHKGEAFARGIARHEHCLAAQIGIKENMKVLNVGCGIGGPGGEICSFTDANIVGINNNIFQAERAIKYFAKAGLSHKLTYLQEGRLHRHGPPIRRKIL
jgi:sterol 24-C-methyltransferase